MRWSGWERNIALGLFGWRLIGFIAFLAGAGRGILIYFPHIFEFWFLYVASRPHWPRWTGRLRGTNPDGTAAPLTSREAIGWLLVVAALKIFHEYTLHTGQWFDKCTPIEFLENISDCIGPV